MRVRSLPRPRLLIALVAVAAVAATVAAVGAANGAAGSAGARAPQGPPEALPDLTIQFLEITLESGEGCDFTSTDLGVRIHFENIGDADAGPFDVAVNDVWQTVSEGLPAGEKGSVWFTSSIYSGTYTGGVDVEEEIVESDETNNSFEGMLPIPTLPPTCTPTPSATPTQTPERPELLGDVDCDGEITSLDALLVLQIVAVLIDELPCPDAADADLDGEVTAVDAAIILQVVAGLIGVF